jgi:DNA-binding NarL/FixJ family response regulator
MATSTPERLRVLIASDRALIADTVRAALAAGGHDVAVVEWPADPAKHQQTSPDSDHGIQDHGVGLLLCDLDQWSTVQTASSVVGSIGVPWVVLTGSPRGPSWGALLEAGVELILGEDTRLEEIGDVLVAVAENRVSTPSDERAELTTAWRGLRSPHYC